ncbi:alpha-amylase [Photobacterium piscicola]
MNNNNHKADQANKNKGTTGTNKTYQKVLDNRSQQLSNKKSDNRSQQK